MEDPNNPQSTGETPPENPPENNPTPAGGDSPYFVAKSKDELDQKLGSERTAAQLALAQEYGFDNVTDFQAFVKSQKEKTDADKSEAERLKEENANRKKNETLLQKENRQLKISQAARDIAVDLEVNPKKVSDVMTLAGVKDIPLAADGSVDAAAVKKAMKDVLTRNPFFKGSGGTSIGGGGNPADAASNALTLDQKIQKAQKEGRFMDVIGLQMQKLRQQ